MMTLRMPRLPKAKNKRMEVWRKFFSSSLSS